MNITGNARPGRPPHSTEQAMASATRRLKSRVRETENGCWEYIGCLVDGYASIRFKDKVIKGHRLSYMIAFGDIPDGLLVCHKCDNRKCVNPDHLFLGTNFDNQLDAALKGRKLGNTRLKPSEVATIRKLVGKGGKQHEIGAMFGISQAMVSRIMHRQKWKNVP